jgi:hypothetical protein
MKTYLFGIAKRLITAVPVVAAVVGVSTLAMHAPAQNQDSLAFKSIQTNKATLFYADGRPAHIGAWFVEMVLPGTAESKAATENLKSVVAAL